MTSASRVSVVIPILDEAAHLERCLDSVRDQGPVGEILVVDGGSADATPRILERARARFEERGIPLRAMRAERGRATQMNAGAAAARGDLILFLHADTILPPGGAAAALRSIEADHVGGAFRHAFNESGIGLRAISAWANVRSRLTRCYFGDQALFARRDVFENLHGFRPIPIMEDVEFSRRLRRAGSTTLLALRVKTSGRRFLSQGIARTCAKMIWLRTAWRLGADPEALKRRYQEIR